ncbi:MAG TPA: family 78 glycoside hydrolase catalytic domain [Candidatus Hydrogenedentes bacterium]|nr:family 78 glycoside hydrolase catalytic domain [Candidatus Hydrogenedentota bacterium]
MWLPNPGRAEDCYGALRGVFTLSAPAEVEIFTAASGWFQAWLDGKPLCEGPARYVLGHPEADRLTLAVPSGRHVIAIQAHNLGVTTRMIKADRPFVSLALRAAGQAIPLRWRCLELAGYAGKVRRVNPQLGWIEWCDTRNIPPDWQQPDFDDSAWPEPVLDGPDAATLPLTGLAPMKRIVHGLEPVASGPVAAWFGYERDDIPARFFLRDLECREVPPQGVWRRYDLGRVRLGRPSFLIDAPAGTEIEFAYSEYLSHGRVSPYINLSAGDSCNLDHYVARGGPQRFEPITPKGGRFLEVHALVPHGAPPDGVRFLEERYIERSYFERPDGAFECDDPLLNRIWITGADTCMACSEDAMIDNPTRERGQWLGDSATAGLNITCAAFADLRLARRCLVQAALCAREDGLVSGMSPGGDVFVSTFSAQWFSGCLDYYRFTGDRSLLEQLRRAAGRNLAAFEPFLGHDGLRDSVAWEFVDWGYKRNEGFLNAAPNFFFLAGMHALAEWARIIEDPELERRAEEAGGLVEQALLRWRDEMMARPEPWAAMGYHAAVLSLGMGMVPPEREPEAVAFIKQHMLDCFPNNPGAPRNSDPLLSETRLITPFFGHFAMPVLIERGEMDFVLDQYRKCWGEYMLAEGRTTWIEVFDPRWSHCHNWAGCPTWQLSAYGLGLWHRFDLGRQHYAFSLRPGSLRRVRGKVPAQDAAGPVEVAWERADRGIAYRLRPAEKIWVHAVPGADGPVELEPDREALFNLPDLR